MQLKLVYIFLCTLAVNFCNGQSPLVAQLSQVKLPTRMEKTTVSYDGDDTIYIFGGFRTAPLYRSRDILEYRISTDSIRIQPAGTFPIEISSGTVTRDRFGNYYYFGGFDDDSLPSQKIYHFSPATGQVVELGSFSNSLFDAVGFQYNDTISYIVGRSPTAMVQFDLDGVQLNVGVRLPVVLMRTGVFWNGNQTAYVIGSSQMETGPPHVIIKYDIPSGQAVLMGEIDFPDMNSTPATTWDSRFEFAYAIGGFEQNDAIMRMNLGTESIEMLPVENFPGGGRTMFYNSAAAYVEKLNRIYFFGGRTLHLDTLDGESKDDIWFIQL
ncbi:hypothetical protein Fcan01_01424 [Folsomia candida]|uniref:Uncharacterized protein n=1 Tax=Folsomia candida TaxID=158441 RepID=A0A226F6C5_FOLCA|nr:hypothetical protein Fcan01_01424 [Folsomia candida]